ncbi:MAG: DNA helicase UvrD [Flavobacterium sp.]|nr:MAG: DNA helicase UvrD [Flavobacterium sp.]
MDKRVIFAVAGSGKTTYLINSLNLDKRFLIVTYTTVNFNNIREKIIAKFSYFPNNIKLYTYFTFLYSFCYRPFLAYKLGTKGLLYSHPPTFPASPSKENYYISNHRLYSNRLAKFIETKGVLGDLNERLEKYFDCFYIDEIQDFAGHDFNLLKSISQANISILFVGDYFQHTYDTSRDGQINKNLHANYISYQDHFSKMGLVVDLTTLSKSYRCSPTVCRFISERLGIEIGSHRNDISTISFIDTDDHLYDLHSNNSIVKLFYQEHYKYNCFSRNWGDSKGEDKFGTILVVLNKGGLIAYHSNTLNKLNPQTRNKLYVACSRARNDIFFAADSSLKRYKQST